MMFQGIKMNVRIRTARKDSLMTKPLMYIMARDLVEAQHMYGAYLRDTAMRRISDPGLAGRGDFMDAM